jgi:hypothetical protein
MVDSERSRMVELEHSWMVELERTSALDSSALLGFGNLAWLGNLAQKGVCMDSHDMEA